MAGKKIDLFYVEAGGGHRAAATALKTVIDGQSRGWRVRSLNLNRILLEIDIVKKLTGWGLEDIYNLILRKGWTLGAEQLMKPMHGLIWLYHGQQVKLLEKFWREDPPDMAVSLIPHFNRALFQGLRRVSERAPFVTILTDFADIPPRVWLERQPQYVICGTSRAVEQAYSFDHPAERVFQVSGMILRPGFYHVPPVDRGLEREKLGLRADVPTGLVLFGGEGASVMVDIAVALRDAQLPLQLILMYGRNERLGGRLMGIGQDRMPVHVQGFTAEVPRFMQLADFMIGKPGPGSISEALAMRLPVLIERNAWTMPQERYNSDWVAEHGVGVVVRDFRREVVAAVRKLLEPCQLDAYRQRVAGIGNRAVFEIPEILEGILGATVSRS